MGEKRVGCFTASLQMQFVSVARIGDFITCQPEVIRATRDLVSVRGLVKTGDKSIASAEGVWKRMSGAS